MSERIDVNPKILGGISICLILELVSAGYDFKRIIYVYPDLTEEDIKSAINY